ncbi:MAG TPA: hypothetical protein VL463_11535 [Kofleriaceae bacterium]|nr:hypothetical protein [Kofleriaceae bacterium]
MSAPLSGSGHKMMKVLCPIEKEGDKKGTFWIRCGTAFVNRDQSINLYLDMLPRNGKLQVREMDEDDLRARDASMARKRGQIALAEMPAANGNDIPF